MKVMSLNTWGGRAGLARLQKFFCEHQETDIFCLQEMWQVDDIALIEEWDQRIETSLLTDIANCLPNHRFFFRPHYRGVYGLATFVRKDIAVHQEGEFFVFKQQGFENPMALGNHARNIQFLKVGPAHEPLMIINFHGLWNGKGKTDSQDRVQQSQLIADFIRSENLPTLLVGDFNLLPDTESFRSLTEVCPQDLITKHKVTSTRSRFYAKAERLADYMLATPTIGVKNFRVLPDEVSDHLPLEIELVL